MPPRKEEMLRIINYFEASLAELGVTIHLNKEFKKEDASNFDYVFVAVGSSNAKPRIEGIDNPNVLSSWDILAHKEIPFGKVIVCGGGLVGVETAEYLAERGHEVEIIEMQKQIAKEESSTILPTINKSFKEHNVKIHLLSKIKSFDLDGVNVDILDENGNVIKQEKIYGDTIVTALTSSKNKFELEGVANVVYIGDCLQGKPNRIANAIKTAYDEANKIN